MALASNWELKALPVKYSDLCPLCEHVFVHRADLLGLTRPIEVRVSLREWAGSMMHDKIFEVLPRLQSDWGGLSTEFLEAVHARLRATEEDGFLSWNLYTLATWYERWFK